MQISPHLIRSTSILSFLCSLEFMHCHRFRKMFFILVVFYLQQTSDHWKTIILDGEKHTTKERRPVASACRCSTPKVFGTSDLEPSTITWFPNHEVPHIESKNTPSFFVNGVQWNSEHLIIYCTSSLKIIGVRYDLHTKK